MKQCLKGIILVSNLFHIIKSSENNQKNCVEFSAVTKDSFS